MRFFRLRRVSAATLALASIYWAPVSPAAAHQENPAPSPSNPTSAPRGAQAVAAPKALAPRIRARMPVLFEANQGQASAGTLYTVHSGTMDVRLRKEGITLERMIPASPASAQDKAAASQAQGQPELPPGGLNVTRESVEFQGANPDVSVEPLDQQTAKANYFFGPDPKRWVTDIHSYARVRYHNLYPGIDLIFYGAPGRKLEYDLVVAAGADPAQIRLKISGDQKPRIDESGNLLLDGTDGKISLDRPIFYQDVANRKRTVSGGFVSVGENEFAFAVADYDRSRPLIIDPTLSLIYSTLLGGVHDDEATNIVLDSSKNSYIVGFSASTDFPVSANAYQPDRKAVGTYIYNAVVLKFDPVGNLLYSTYIGGTGQGVNYSGGDFGTGITVDANGDAFICGNTNSLDFPITSNAYSSTAGAGFVSEISPDGSTLEYSTYFPQSVSDIASNPQGQLVLAGTAQPGLPTTSNAYMPTLSTGYAAFASILDLTQSGSAQLTASSYYGASNPTPNSIAMGNFQYGLAIDASGNVWLGGESYTGNLPTTANAYQQSVSLATACNTPQPTTLQAAAFIAELGPDLSQLKYGTYFSGQTSNSAYTSFACQEWVEDMQFDSKGNLYLAGTTSSPNFPTTPGAYLSGNTNGTSALWVAQFNPSQFTATSSAPVWSTLVSNGVSLGGSNGYIGNPYATYTERSSNGNSMAVDEAGNVWIAGQVIAGLDPVFMSKNAFETTDNEASGGGFFAEVGAGGTQVPYGSFLVGASTDVVAALAVDSSDDLYMVGVTEGEQQSVFDSYNLSGYAYAPYEFPVTANALQDQFANGDANPDGNDMFFTILGGGSIGSVGPTSGASTGDVTLTISGAGFQSGATCEMILNGTIITSTSSRVNSSGTSITCTFALSGAASGSYNVEVANPNGGSTFTANNAFTVSGTGGPNPWINVVGRDLIRTGAPSLVTISYGNSGNTDAYFTQLDVQFSTHLSATYTVGATTGVGLTTPAVTSGTNATGSYLSLIVPHMPAGSSGSFVVAITDSTNGDNYTVTASVGHAWYATADQANAELTAQSQTFSPSTSCETPSSDSPTVSSCLANYLTGLQTADSLSNTQVQAVAANMLLMLQQSQSGPPPMIGGTTVSSSSLQFGTGTLVVSGIPSTDDEVLFHVTGTSQQYLIPINSSNCVSTADNLGGSIGESYLTCTFTNVTAPEMNGVIFAGESVNIGPGSNIVPNPDACFTTSQNVSSSAFTATAAAGQCIIGNLDPPEDPSDGANPPPPPPPPPIPPNKSSTLPGGSGGSEDPNGKSGTTGDMSASQYVSGTAPLPYQIFFENEATATLPAATVVVTDKLNPALVNLQTIALGPISWGGSNTITPPPGVTSYATTYTPPGVTTYVVNVQGSLNTNTGVLTWTLQTLDPSTHLPPTDPTVGFLPPDADGVEGQGSVDFTVTPDADLITGTQIANTATVVFDTNAPINTKTWTNTIDVTPPTSSVTALPATTTQTSFTVSWSGKTVASAIAYYNIYVSTNGGAFTLWQSAVTTTSATFAGTAGDTYGFFSQAVDEVGNSEALKAQADTTTQILGASSIVTTWPTASAITYGQTLASSNLTGGVASVPGAFAFTTPTTAPVAGTQTESITFTPTNTGEYSPLSSTVSVLVNKASTSISVEPTASSLTSGQTLASSTLTGGTAVSTITHSSVAGAFSFTTPTTVPPSGSSSQSVTFTPTDANDYLSTTGSVTVQVTAVSLTITWPTASAITYGQPLSASTLSGGSAMSGNTTVTGTFAFTTPTTAPVAGTQAESVTFTPTNTNEYSPVASTVSVVVNKAPTKVTVEPTAGTLSYGQTLASATLTGGTAVSTVTNASVAGAFTFTTPTTEPPAGSSSESVTFTPTDTSDYLSATGSVTVQVSEASLTITWPTASAITYGQPLSASTLSGGSAKSGNTTVTGTFAFTTPTTAPVAGTQVESVTFTPTNTNEYSPVASNVSVVVNKAPTKVTVEPTASTINSGQTLAASTLTGGAAVSTITAATVPGVFTFTSPSTAPTDTGPESVTFTPSDANDYLGTTTSVTVTVNQTPAPVATVTPSSINFGTVYLGSIITKTVTLENTGNATMTIKDPLLSVDSGGDSSEFITVNLCPKSLAPGKSCIMTVTFLAGPFYNEQTATVQINDNAAGSPQRVALTATVIDPVAQFSLNSLNFGTVKEGVKSAAKSITLTSVGGTPLSISKVSIGGADAGDFSATNNCVPEILKPKAACTITVTFKPAAKGARAATLQITDNALLSQRSIPLTGSGD